MSDKSSPLKRLVIEINGWVKFPEGEKCFYPVTDSYASNPVLINCMERVSYDEIPKNRIPTLRRDLLEVAIFLRWVEAKKVSLEVESEDWRRLLLHQMCLVNVVSTKGREENSFRLPSMRVVSFDNMCCSGIIAAELHEIYAICAMCSRG
ncbi:hypothetical protein Tco_0652309 [Tanacetum coccineum]|uniref:Uncharacterized protein n=1 Tax=Tanacetum coccineum TaxID=301880 RepID=A0ABQ4WXF2_9ASTR